jgi:hypothetical protein
MEAVKPSGDREETDATRCRIDVFTIVRPSMGETKAD